MPRSFPPLYPVLATQLMALGERLRAARLRRSLTAQLMAERIGVSRATLHRLEKGDANIAMGTYLRALRVLGLDQDINLLAKDDVVGRKLQDQALRPRHATKEPALTQDLGQPLAVEEGRRQRNQKTLVRLLDGRRKGKANGTP